MEITGNGSQDITTETSEWASRYNISRSSLGPHSAILNMLYLDVFCKRIEDLLGDRQGFGKIVLSRFINDVLP